MTITVLKQSEADAYLKNISIKAIKDVRALDVDLMLVLVNGDRIIINNGAVNALSSPEMALHFVDGQLPLASVFQQIDKIDVSPEASHVPLHRAARENGAGREAHPFGARHEPMQETHRPTSQIHASANGRQPAPVCPCTGYGPQSHLPDRARSLRAWGQTAAWHA
ncbi:hypothetical protein [Herbaspirillum sp.]|uniref:hypothetical protein n=1 Tax=Herbaspirillum sp. TaxID=1890675 RepID=UPI0031DEB732